MTGAESAGSGDWVAPARPGSSSVAGKPFCLLRRRHGPPPPCLPACVSLPGDAPFDPSPFPQKLRRRLSVERLRAQICALKKPEPSSLSLAYTPGSCYSGGLPAAVVWCLAFVHTVIDWDRLGSFLMTVRDRSVQKAFLPFPFSPGFGFGVVASTIFCNTVVTT